MSDTAKVTIVTGASEGIGAELARVFWQKGHALVLVARRKDRLDALAAELAKDGARPAPLVVELDLCAPGAVETLAEALKSAELAAEYLVNNAGFGLMGAAAKLDPAQQVQMVDLNVRALTALTLRFLPQIIAAKGGVLNVASVASFMPGPNFAVYYATKAYVRSFSEALAQELAAEGVKVSCLCPGPVETGFQARAGFDFSGGMGAAKAAMVSAAEVARQGYEGLIAGQRVVVPGLPNKIMILVAGLLPRAVLMPMLAAMQKGR